MNDYIAMLDMRCLKDGEKINASPNLPSTVSWCKVTWLFLSALTFLWVAKLVGFFLRKIHQVSQMCPHVFNKFLPPVQVLLWCLVVWVMLWHIQQLNQLFDAIDCYSQPGLGFTRVGHF